MIFAVWFCAWVFLLATSALHLILPATCLVVRGSYLSRSALPGRTAVFISAFVFLLVRVTLPDKALLFGVRTFLMLAMLTHLVSAVRSTGLRLVRRIPVDPANFLHLLTRSFRVTQERLGDLRYTKGLRIRREPSPLRRAWLHVGLNAAYWKASVLELLQLTTTFEDMIRTRGRFPHPSEWQDPKRIQSWLYAADLVLLATVLVGFVGVGQALLPADLLQWAQRLRDGIAGVSGF